MLRILKTQYHKLWTKQMHALHCILQYAQMLSKKLVLTWFYLETFLFCCQIRLVPKLCTQSFRLENVRNFSFIGFTKVGSSKYSSRKIYISYFFSLSLFRISNFNNKSKNISLIEIYP